MNTEKKDPIKPHKSFSKKPNFKKERLDTDFLCKVHLNSLYGQFRSPGINTREMDTSQINETNLVSWWDLSEMDGNRVDNHEHGTLVNNERRRFTINVGEIDQIDVEEYTRRIQQYMRTPPQHLNEDTSFITIHKKKTIWGRVKQYFLRIYKKWKRAE